MGGVEEWEKHDQNILSKKISHKKGSLVYFRLKSYLSVFLPMGFSVVSTKKLLTYIS